MWYLRASLHPRRDHSGHPMDESKYNNTMMKNDDHQRECDFSIMLFSKKKWIEIDETIKCNN